MRKIKIQAAFSTFAAVLFLFSGCSLWKGKDNSSSAVPAASFGSSSAESSQQQNSSALPSNQAQSPSSVSSAGANSREPSESQEGPVVTIQTDSKYFNAKFKNNPIDKKYITESNNAISSVDMVNVSDKYAKIWQQEIDYAYKELTAKIKSASSSKQKTLKAEQEKWEKGKEAAIKKISDNAYSTGGSMASVEEASGIMDFYRSRAAQLYRELYDYEKEYSYNFKSK
jgi:uncharacterized protein YecT (DUF1311 family)